MDKSDPEQHCTVPRLAAHQHEEASNGARAGQRAASFCHRVAHNKRHSDASRNTADVKHFLRVFVKHCRYLIILLGKQPLHRSRFAERIGE